MARKFLKSGELLFWTGSSMPTEQEEKNYLQRRKEVLVVLIILAWGVLYLAPLEMVWPALSHTVKAFVTAVW